MNKFCLRAVEQLNWKRAILKRAGKSMADEQMLVESSQSAIPQLAKHMMCNICVQRHHLYVLSKPKHAETYGSS